MIRGLWKQSDSSYVYQIAGVWKGVSYDDEDGDCRGVGCKSRATDGLRATSYLLCRDGLGEARNPRVALVVQVKCRYPGVRCSGLVTQAHIDSTEDVA